MVTFNKKINAVVQTKTSWNYNYYLGREETGEVITLDNDITIPKYAYNYIVITTDTKPQYKECVEKVIRQYYSQSQEFDLINSANKDMMSGKNDTEDIKKYKEYLKLVEEIKAKVKKDLKV